MKISRPEPVRRRRNPLSMLLIIAGLIVVGLLVVAWMRGGTQAPKTVEIAVPAEALGH